MIPGDSTTEADTMRLRPRMSADEPGGRIQHDCITVRDWKARPWMGDRKLIWAEVCTEPWLDKLCGGNGTANSVLSSWRRSFLAVRPRIWSWSRWFSCCREWSDCRISTTTRERKNIVSPDLCGLEFGWFFGALHEKNYDKQKEFTCRKTNWYF